MKDLSTLINELSSEHCDQLSQEFVKTGAQKYLTLFGLVKEGAPSNKQMIERLKLNENSFYVLKSRLYHKLQKYVAEAQLDFSGSVSLALEVVRKTLREGKRESAKAMLFQLERVYQERDLPMKLVLVYRELQSFFILSPHYEKFQQAYKEALALSQQIYQQEDDYIAFCQKMHSFCVSRDLNQLDELIALKWRIEKTANGKSSHHLKVFRLLADLSFALNVPQNRKLGLDRGFEEKLEDLKSILFQFGKDPLYKDLQSVYHAISFQYHLQSGQPAKAERSFQSVNRELSAFLELTPYYITTQFLIAKTRWYKHAGKSLLLLQENTALREKIFTPQEPASYILYVKYLAICHYANQEYGEAVKLLTGLLNDLGFKHFPHAEVEIKVWLSMLYALEKKVDLGRFVLRNVSRKIRELNKSTNMLPALKLCKVIHGFLHKKSAPQKQKIESLLREFHQENTSHATLLDFIDWENSEIKRLLTPDPIANTKKILSRTANS